MYLSRAPTDHGRTRILRENILNKSGFSKGKEVSLSFIADSSPGEEEAVYNIIPCSFHPGEYESFSVMAYSYEDVSLEQVPDDVLISLPGEWDETTSGFLFPQIFKNTHTFG